MYLFDMYTLLSLEKLSEMRKYNEERLKLNEEITSLKVKSVNKKEPFLFKEQPAIMDFCADLFVNGNLSLFPHGAVTSHSLMPFYYRGEVREHKTCYSSLFRKLKEMGNLSDDEKRREIFLNQLKISEFSCLIQDLFEVVKWPYGDIFSYAIAQHYGFYTDIIDCTNDLDVALFFACCKHEGNNRYSPLTKEDIESEEYRYGYLYENKARDSDISLALFHIRLLSMLPQNDNFVIRSAIEDSNWNQLMGKPLLVLPIGYQPFTRCNRQRGYFIHPYHGDDLKELRYFKKIYKFEHSVELSEELCDKYKGGEKLFNCEIGDELSDIIKAIRHADTFSTESFEDAYYYLHGNLSREYWRKNLEENKLIKIGKVSYELSEEKREIIKKKWSIEKFIKEEGIFPGNRKVFSDSDIDVNFSKADIRFRELFYTYENPDFYNSLKACVDLRKNAIRERKKGKNRSRKLSIFKK